jgi:hypothetical protein
MKQYAMNVWPPHGGPPIADILFKASSEDDAWDTAKDLAEVEAAKLPTATAIYAYGDPKKDAPDFVGVIELFGVGSPCVVRAVRAYQGEADAIHTDA